MKIKALILSTVIASLSVDAVHGRGLHSLRLHRHKYYCGDEDCVRRNYIFEMKSLLTKNIQTEDERAATMKRLNEVVDWLKTHPTPSTDNRK